MMHRGLSPSELSPLTLTQMMIDALILRGRVGLHADVGSNSEHHPSRARGAAAGTTVTG